MEENTLFQGEHPENQKPVNSGPTPISPVAKQVQQEHTEDQTSPFSSFGGIPPTNDNEEHGFPFSRIMKFFIGILVVLGIGYGVFFYVLPLFSSKEKNVTVTYWGLWEPEATMQQIIGDFEREQPNIKVKYVRQDVKQYRERLVTRIPNGNGPDIFRYHNTWLPMMKRYLSPLPESVISKATFQKIYYPVVQQDVVANGAIYGIPLQTDTLAMFVNKEILAAGGVAVPKTWDEFNTVTRTLTVKDETGAIKTAGAAIGTFDNITHAPDIIALLLLQNGANVTNLLETPENASDALTFYTSFAKGEGNIWDETLDPSIVMFARGNVGIYFGYSWDIFAIKAANPSLSFEVYPVPSIPGREMSIASYWVEGVSIKSQHQKEAMLFMNYLSKKETQQKLFTEAAKTRQFGELYSNIELANTLKGNSLLYPFLEQSKKAVSSFFVGETYDNGINADMNTYLGNAIRSILGNTSAQSAVETLAKGVTQVLQQYAQ